MISKEDLEKKANEAKENIDKMFNKTVEKLGSDK